MGPGSLAAYPLTEPAEEMQAETGRNPLAAQELSSFQELSGMPIQDRDGDIGRLDDLLVEDESWKVLYIVVDTGSWLPGRKVLVSPSWVLAAEGSASKLGVDLNLETIRNSPEYDPGELLDWDYDSRLYEHYGIDKDW